MDDLDKNFQQFPEENFNELLSETDNNDLMLEKSGEKMFLDPKKMLKTRPGNPPQEAERAFVNFTRRNINGKNYIELKDTLEKRNVYAFLIDIQRKRVMDRDNYKDFDFYTFLGPEGNKTLKKLGKFKGNTPGRFLFDLDKKIQHFPEKDFDELLYETDSNDLMLEKSGGKTKTNRKKSKRKKSKRRKTKKRRSMGHFM